MKVIWIDPGETVGWATAEVYPGHAYDPERPTDAVVPASLKVLDYGNTKMKRFCLALLDGAHKYGVIGFETYTIRADRLRMHAGSTVPTLQCVGAIRLAAWEAQREAALGGPKLLEQEPNRQSRGRGAAKLYFSDDIQAAIAHADENPHDEGHYASALLHLAAWYHDYLEGQG